MSDGLFILLLLCGYALGAGVVAFCGYLLGLGINESYDAEKYPTLHHGDLMFAAAIWPATILALPAIAGWKLARHIKEAP